MTSTQETDSCSIPRSRGTSMWAPIVGALGVVALIVGATTLGFFVARQRGQQQLIERLQAIEASFDVGLDDLEQARLMAFSKKTTDEDLRLLERFPQVKFVLLDSPQVTDHGLSYVVAHKPQGLNLGIPQITPEGVRRLADCDNLKNLAFMGDWVSDETIRSLPEFPALETLQLYRTSVTVEGMKSVAKCRRLRKVSLIRTKGIDDNALNVLQPLASLEEIEVIDCPISDEQREVLKERYSRVNVLP